MSSLKDKPTMLCVHFFLKMYLVTADGWVLLSLNLVIEKLLGAQCF